MSATVTSTNARLPVTRFGGLIAGAMIAIAAAALIGIAVYTFVVRDNGPAAAFDPTAAQRIQVVREYGSAATYDANPALGQHVVRGSQAPLRLRGPHSPITSCAKTPTKSVALSAAGTRNSRGPAAELSGSARYSRVVRCDDSESYFARCCRTCNAPLLPKRGFAARAS